jgi:hypothetical protein
MKKFLVIYAMPTSAIAEMMKNMTPEEMEKGKEEWRMWMEKHAEHMVDPGNPVGKNTRVTKDGVTEVSNEIAGYSVFHGESKEAVAKMVADSPHLQVPDGYIEIMEAIHM